ncbi:MAG: hypothetical protein GY851_26460 [bacterium]|nr:hypothetical protein [bacterium]
MSAWVPGRGEAPQVKLDYQAEYYTHLYRMFTGSCIDGIFFWWYPGGYRVNEHSDYGIVNADGSDRPVSKVIRDNADALLNGPGLKPVDTWLEFDRDTHCIGLTGVYDELEDEFWAAIEAGRTPGLRTEATGSDSANCPALAVGNMPWTGTNPPKYLDGFFDKVEVLNAKGEWQTVASGGSVSVKPGPVQARIAVTNLAEAAWLAPGANGDTGSIYLEARAGETTATPLPKDVARHASIVMEDVSLGVHTAGKTGEVALTFHAKDRTHFGPKFRLNLTD